MSDVFVSYKAEDRKRVKPLVEALQADGYSVWWDEQIGGGAQWRHMIEAELNAAKCVIVIWSKRSIGPEGNFVQDEATRAQERHVYVPVLLDKVHLPLGFGEMQALPLTGWKGDRSDPHYVAILSSVRRIAGSTRRTVQPHANGQAHLSRRAVVGGGLVAAAAVAGIGGWTLFKPSAASASGSIAVLPFANLSGDPAQAYFSDGIAEELRSALARLAGLKVVGRTSSEAVRGDDAETAAKKLVVANILTGSVRQSASTIRISAQLIDGRSGIEKWSESYDRSPGDAIKIQTDIAENVARSLSAALGNAARAAITVGGTENAEAQKLLLQATEAGSNNSQEGYLRALSLLNAATALDPRYADAYARKAFFLEIYADTYANGLSELSDYRAQALQAAETAMRLAPDFAGSHIAVATIRQGTLNLGPAAAEYRRALELAPSDPQVIGQYASMVGRFGHSSEALQLADRAVALDPLNPVAYRTRVFALFGGRKYADVVTFSQQLQRKSPQLFDWPEVVGAVLVFLNRLDEAQSYFQLALPDNYRRLVGESDLLIRSGRRPEVSAKLAALQQRYGEAASYQFGEIYALLGDKDRAFAALDRAWEIRDSGLFALKADPYMDPLRSDPRFAALLRKMNFPA